MIWISNSSRSPTTSRTRNARRAIERCVERFGGQRDGVLRNWTPYRGEIADVYRYTITEKQYREAVGRK